MKKNKISSIFSIIAKTAAKSPLLCIALILTIAGLIVATLVPPLILERIVDAIAKKSNIFLPIALLYFASLAATGLLDSLKETLITLFGQKITHGVRSEMCAKLSKLPASYFVKTQAGAVASRFVGDVDTLEALFASGIVGMFIDLFKIISILLVIFIKSTGIGILMLAVIPPLFIFTRLIQRKMLAAQLNNRISAAKLNNHIPETIRNIDMLHIFRKEKYMEEKYDEKITESYNALDRASFCDAIYSPIVTVIGSVIIAVMMVLAAMGGEMQVFFGMSVGGAVAIIAYVRKIFSPLENIGMEIQNIQSAVAGVKRICNFLDTPERGGVDLTIKSDKIITSTEKAIELNDVCFGYDDDYEVLHKLSFSVRKGEMVTLAGRTGAGKSTVFKLLLGLYTPSYGSCRVFGVDADKIPDKEKRRLFGYVEQAFRPVQGTVFDQICVYDDSITQKEVEAAAKLAGIHDAICNLSQGYMTKYSDDLFSKGQQQLISIARAVAANPAILLLDEITASLDSQTEKRVLEALKNASLNRTVLSISHRLYENSINGKIISIGSFLDN